MGIPLLLSIPYLQLRNAQRAKTRKKHLPLITNGEGDSEMAVFGGAVQLKQSFDSIRDRLILFFELNNLRHRPKLVAVVGCAEGGGASTIAGGLAAALAETGEGKVLLVDMNGAHAAIHPFFVGSPSCTVAEALQAEAAIPSASENLYLAKAEARGGGQMQLIPRRFSDMVPHFKASVYDYIVFDMPPLNQSCSALAIAASVDKVLLVVEAGKTYREAVKRTYGELVAARANVSCILNKNRSFGSRWIQKGV
jgi:Mrp family chromosome partitioning ATPase